MTGREPENGALRSVLVCARIQVKVVAGGFADRRPHPGGIGEGGPCRKPKAFGLQIIFKVVVGWHP